MPVHVLLLTLCSTILGQAAYSGRVTLAHKVGPYMGGFMDPLSHNASFGSDLATVGNLDGLHGVDIVVTQDGRGVGGARQQKLWSLFLFPNLTVASHRIIGSVQGYPDSDWPPAFQSKEIMNAVAPIGDANSDGVPDVVFGNMGEEITAGTGGISYTSKGGAGHGLLMNSDGTGAAKTLIGTGGFGGRVVTGDRLGASVDALSDLNGDGTTDVIIGCPGKSLETGAFFMVHLTTSAAVKAGGVGVGFVLYKDDGSTPFGTTPMPIPGVSLSPGDRFCEEVANIMDLNGDGYEDVALGAPGAGRVYIAFLGRAAVSDNMRATVESTMLIDATAGTNSGGLVLDISAEFGDAIVSPGDLDGDGVFDLMVGAPGDGTGKIFSFLLRIDGTVRSYAEVMLPAGAVSEGGRLGAALARGWDWSGDGRGGILASAPADDHVNVSNAGSVFFITPEVVCMSDNVTHGAPCMSNVSDLCTVSCHVGYYAVGAARLCNATSLWTAQLEGSPQNCTACDDNVLCPGGVACSGAGGEGEYCPGGCADSAYDNNGTCTVCSSCGVGEGTVSPCNSSSDVVCEPCSPGNWSGQGDADCFPCDPNPLCVGGPACLGNGSLGETCPGGCALHAYNNSGVCVACDANSLCAGGPVCSGPVGVGESCPGGCVRTAYDDRGKCRARESEEDSTAITLQLRLPESATFDEEAFITNLAAQLDVHPDRINVTVIEDDAITVTLHVDLEGRLAGEAGNTAEEAVRAVRLATVSAVEVGGYEPVSVSVVAITDGEVEVEPVVLASVHPTLSILAGGEVHVLAGKKFDASMLVLVDGEAIPDSNFSYYSPRAAAFIAPMHSEEAYYADITVFNGEGSMASLIGGLYYTDDCPVSGMYGRGADCVACPIGAICPGGNRMWAKPGYWTPSEKAGYVVACPDPSSRCLGGRGGQVDCSVGYTSVACGSCDEGYQEYFGECVPCDGESESRFTALLLSGVFFLCLFLVATVFASDNILTTIVEILASAQIVGALSKIGSPHSPSFLKRVRSIYSMLLLDFEYLEPGCNLGTTGFIDIFWANLTFFFVLLFISEGALVVMHTVRGKQGKQTNFYSERMIRTVGILLHMFYANLVVRAVESFSCVDVGGSTRLRKDYKIHCFQGPHLPAFVVSIFIGIYALAFPCGVLMFLTKCKDQFEDKVFRQRHGYFFELCKPTDYYYTVLMICVTLIITIASLMAVSWTRLGIVVTTLLFLLGVVMSRRPFLKAYKNVTAAAAITVPITASVYDVLVASGYMPISSTESLTLAYIVAILMIALLVAIITTLLSIPFNILFARKNKEGTYEAEYVDKLEFSKTENKELLAMSGSDGSSMLTMNRMCSAQMVLEDIDESGSNEEKSFDYELAESGDTGSCGSLKKQESSAAFNADLGSSHSNGFVGESFEVSSN